MSWLLAICAAECLCDAPLSGCPVVFCGWFGCPRGCRGCGSVWFRGVFDTPVFACVSNGFGGVRVGRGCVCAGVGVSFSLAARHGVLPLGAGASGPVRWWFENSRACLYYFMQVNDCQSAVRFPLGSGRGALKVGGVFVR